VTKGTIFDIQRFSIHDGPGIRTTVFFKGCSLRCFWCHNPEGIRFKQEIQYFPERCIGCGKCLEVCPQVARLKPEDGVSYQRELCTVCGSCVTMCAAEARLLTGREVTVDEVMAELLQDRVFYETSKGGVTLSGGDPILQPEFATALLQACKKEGLHTAIETAGNYEWEILAALLPEIDLVMMDIKHMDPSKHRWATGVSNKRILAIARKLAQTQKPLLFRIPVIPTVNDTVEEVGAIAAFVKELVEIREKTQLLNARTRPVYQQVQPVYAQVQPAVTQAEQNTASIQLQLLTFHRLAGDKYRSLGLQYRAAGLEVPAQESMQQFMEAAAACGVLVT
jgi:pyruvate formate lyase activating enzyme